MHLFPGPGLVTVWEKSQFKRNRSVNVKDFIPVIPDVNYNGDINREPGLEYMLALFKRMGIKKWLAQLEAIMNNFSKGHYVDVRGLDN